MREIVIRNLLYILIFLLGVSACDRFLNPTSSLTLETDTAEAQGKQDSPRGQRVVLQNECSSAAYVTFRWKSSDGKQRMEELKIFDKKPRFRSFKGGTIGIISYKITAGDIRVKSQSVSKKSCGGDKVRFLTLWSDGPGKCKVESFCSGKIKIPTISKEKADLIRCLRRILDKHRPKCVYRCKMENGGGCLKAHRSCLEALEGEKLCESP